MESADQNTRASIPDWLKNLQENSWELELLVSGGAIFSLFQLSDAYIEWIRNIKTIGILPGSNAILMLGVIGIKILTSGFMLHLILRAFWLGLVCVNYVYPGGIRAERHKVKKPFRIKHPEGDLKDQIMRVDNLCGIIMFTSIISAAVIAGIAFLLCIFFVALVSLEFFFEAGGFAEAFMLFCFFMLLVYVLDLVCMGWFRKIPYLSYFFFPFFKVYDLLSFRSVYERPLILFSTNVKRMSFRLSAFLFVMFAVTLSYLSLYRVMHWPNVFDLREYKWQMADNPTSSYAMYRDQMMEGDRSGSSIQSKIVQSDYLDIFVRYDKRSDYMLAGRENSEEEEVWFSDLIALEIDDSLYRHVEWFPHWNQEIYNIGVSAVLDINHLSDGKHILKIYTDFEYATEEEKMSLGYSESIIPFWKDSD